MQSFGMYLKNVIYQGDECMILMVGVLIGFAIVIGWAIGAGVQFSYHWPWKK